jgi:C-terminal processing protease CtpA/Prc
VASLKLGKFTIDHPVATFAEATKGSDADRSYDGVLGGEILRRFKVTFDYSRRQMILEPNATFAEAYEFDMSGVSLATQEHDFKTIRVSHVQGNSPASEAGLKEGNTLETIDEKPAASLGLEQIEQMFKKDGQEYVLCVKRGDAQIQVRMKIRRLI